jgi:hypothetical protein
MHALRLVIGGQTIRYLKRIQSRITLKQQGQ